VTNGADRTAFDFLLVILAVIFIFAAIFRVSTGEPLLKAHVAEEK
jgi:hypothetical protein